MSPRAFFITAGSFPAPFVSDKSTHYVSAETPEQALLNFAAEYNHSAGLYSAAAYWYADSYHKGKRSLAQWICNKQQAINKATAELSVYTLYSPAHDIIEVDGKRIKIENPKQGSVVA